MFLRLIFLAYRNKVLSLSLFSVAFFVVFGRFFILSSIDEIWFWGSVSAGGCILLAKMYETGAEDFDKQNKP